MDVTGAWTTIAVSAGLLAVSVLVLRHRLPRRWIDVLVAIGGAGVAIGGLLRFDDVGVASWVLAPPFLAAGAIAQWRVLFTSGGAFRT